MIPKKLNIFQRKKNAKVTNRDILLKVLQVLIIMKFFKPELQLKGIESEIKSKPIDLLSQF